MGNMAQAILKGGLLSGVLQPQNTYMYDPAADKVDGIAKEYGVQPCKSAAECCQSADMVLLCVKPNVAKEVLSGMDLTGKALVSIVTGLSYETMDQLTAPDTRKLRIMPNTPMMIGKGATVFAAPSSLSAGELVFAKNLFLAGGEVWELPEEQIAAVTGISGSGPAYGYLFIDAMAKAGEAHGLTYETSLKLAAQTVLGSASMILAEKGTPQELTRAVCSPGGTTIEAVGVFQKEEALDTLVQDAIRACVNKAELLAKQSR